MKGHLKFRLPEHRSSVGDLVPALDHEGVHPAGAILGAGQQLPTSDHLNYLNFFEIFFSRKT